MNCEQIRLCLVEELYGDAALGEWSAAVADHLQACATCQQEANQLRQAHRALQELAATDEDNANEELASEELLSCAPHSKAIQTEQIVQRAHAAVERRGRKWRALGIAATAACVLFVVAMLAGMRVNWAADGVSIAWQQGESDTNGDGSSAAARNRLQVAEQQLAAQREEIASLQASLVAIEDSVSTQQQTSTELIAAVRQNFTAIQMQMERSDFRISVLRANVRDLGNALAQFSAVLGSPVSSTSTQGE